MILEKTTKKEALHPCPKGQGFSAKENKLLMILLLLLVSCSQQGNTSGMSAHKFTCESVDDFYWDTKRCVNDEVVCYVNSAGMSCVPLSDLNIK